MVNVGSKRIRWITWILLLLLLCSIVLNTFASIRTTELQAVLIDSKVKKQIESLNIPAGKDGYTPIKNVDYVDGKDGVTKTIHDFTSTTIEIPNSGPKGDKGDSAYQTWVNLGNVGTEQDFIESLKPQVILPDLKCNIDKNRWETKLPSDPSWQALNGEVVPCKGV